MPELKDWFGDYEPHVSPRKESEHHSSTNGGSSSRRGAPRRDAGDEESRSYRSQFSQNSQMGNFRHHSSRLDERADRDSHERLRNLSEAYDRNKFLASTAAGKREIATKTTPLSSRRADGEAEPTKLSPWDRKDNLRSERSGDWRRPNASTNDSEDASERRGARRTDRGLDPEDGRRDRLRGRGRTPSPSQGGERTRGWERRRSQSRHKDDSNPANGGGDRDRRRKGKDPEASDDRRANGSRRTGGEDRESSSRFGRDSNNLRGEKEPAWMGDYEPGKAGDSGLGRPSESDLDDLQVWKRQLRDKEAAAAAGKPNDLALPEAAPPSDGLDDIQRFKLKMQEEQEKRERPLDAAIDAPPGLSASSNANADNSHSLLPPVDITSSTSSSTTAPVSQVGPPDAQSSLLSRAAEARLISELQSPLSVAGLDSEYLGSISRNGSSRHVSNPSDLATAPLRAPQEAMPSVWGATNPSSNAASSSVPSDDRTFTPPPVWRGDNSPTGTGLNPADRRTPPGQVSPVSAGAGRGSRFAKFWDNKPKEQSSANPSPAPPSNLGGQSQSQSQMGAPFYGGGNGLGQGFPSRPQSGASGNGMGSAKGLDGLLEQLSVQERPQPRQVSSDVDRMQSLLSMLNPTSVPIPEQSLGRQTFLSQQDPPMHQHHAPPSRLPQNGFAPMPNSLPLGSNDFDRSFVPDNLVPGLRPARSREPSVQLPPLNLLNGPNGVGTPFGDDGREYFPQQQRLQHQGSWEQIPNRPILSNHLSAGGPGQPPQGLPRMSQLPPSAQQLNALRQSPNHLLQQQAQQQHQQQQMLRNAARSQFDGPAYSGQQQFAGLSPGGGMNVGGQQFNNVLGNGLGGLGVSPRIQDNLSGQAYGGGGLNGLPPLNGLGGGYDLPPPRSQPSQNRMLMNGLGANGPSMRDLDNVNVRGGQPGMSLYQSQSLPPQSYQQQQQQLLQQQLQGFGGGLPNLPGMSYGGPSPLDSHQHGSMRGAPNDFLAAQHQSFGGGRPYGGPNGNLGPGTPQGQPDLMALLMGRQQPQYRE